MSRPDFSAVSKWYWFFALLFWGIILFVLQHFIRKWW
jgi:hypothetical protein